MRKSFFTSPLFIWILIASGIGLRLIFYLTNRSLWLDEASLALSIVHLEMAEILQPLPYGQAAPPLFLIAIKQLADYMGPGELVLRALPFISGCLALVLFYPLSKRALDMRAAPYALALLAFSRHAIYYSSEFKQYSTDLLGTVVILAAALFVRRSGYKLKSLVLFSFLGSLIIWFAHPSVFILAGVVAAFLVEILSGRGDNPGEYRERLVYVIAAGLACLCSFLISYFFFVRATAHDGFYTFWADGFAPFPPASLADFRWYPQTLLHIIAHPIGFRVFLPLRGLIALTMILGACSLWKKGSRFQLLMIVLPLLLLLAASILKLYPVRMRLILFTAPLFYLLLAEGIHKARGILAKKNAAAALLLVVGFFFYPAWYSLSSAVKPEMRLREEIKPVIEYYMDNRAGGDVLYIYYGALKAFEYHTRDMNIEGEIIPGTGNRREPKKYIEELNDLTAKHGGRIWFIFSHVYASEEELFVSRLNGAGSLVDSYRAVGASIYLYRIHQ